ncbi:MAG: hypothetical protein CTY38_12695 [Methylotenera sp.]|nr:MAG: hypothetical protein CTY38_12695 [Methylotenera sp.]
MMLMRKKLNKALKRQKVNVGPTDANSSAILNVFNTSRPSTTVLIESKRMFFLIISFSHATKHS